MMPPIHKQFTLPLLAWHDLHGRHHLPWKHPVDPYRIWLSEIMLQQTQVKTVIPYFLNFMDRFPNVAALAQASEDDVLSLWSGLGYYSRGRNLHQTARIIQTHYAGRFPDDLQTLVQLPGIGPSTAAAIASQAFAKPTPILDGNVKRVLSRYFMIAGTSTQTTKELWKRAHDCMSHDRPADYTQAIMDLGATCCTTKNPHCTTCPLNQTCQAALNDVVAEFPSKKPKKELPIKYQQFLLMHNQKGLIYLEKRPAKGLWGGLWCTPTIDMDIDPITFIQTIYSHHAFNAQPFMQIKHTFTHFKLYIHALTIETKTFQHVIPEHPCGWFSHAETIKLGLAKPISDMIEQYFASSHHSAPTSLHETSKPLLGPEL